MPIIKIETQINAPIERVFDLARCIDLHTESLSDTKEKVVAGTTKGLISRGETVTWEAVHFGIKQNLTSKITIFEPPHHFRDSMVKGAFKRFDHDHFFETKDSQTIMWDVFDYNSPFGFLGSIADAVFLEGYMTKLLESRNELIKKVAESDDWKKYIS
jgi:ligand-binding SRPBCC domain-containing protein